MNFSYQGEIIKLKCFVEQQGFASVAVEIKRNPVFRYSLVRRLRRRQGCSPLKGGFEVCPRGKLQGYTAEYFPAELLGC